MANTDKLHNNLQETGNTKRKPIFLKNSKLIQTSAALTEVIVETYNNKYKDQHMQISKHCSSKYLCIYHTL